MKKLTFNVPEELHQELKTAAVSSGTTMTELIKKEVLTALTGERGYPVQLTPEQTTALRSIDNVDALMGELIGHAIRVHSILTPNAVPPVPELMPPVRSVVPPVPEFMPPGYVAPPPRPVPTATPAAMPPRPPSHLWRCLRPLTPGLPRPERKTIRI